MNIKIKNPKVLFCRFFIVVLFLFSTTHGFSQNKKQGIRGDSLAIKQLESMVNTMGGMHIWSQLKSVHFVHRWYFWDRDSYLENEILDLTGPRSYVTMKSETYSRIRAYSPEHRYWNIINGKFSYTNNTRLENALERAPFSIYRIARAVATGNSFYKVAFGQEEFPGRKRIELFGPKNKLRGYLVLNHRNEPLVWGTTQYKYTFGPMKKFGNLFVPNWAVTGNGAITYKMVSLTGDNKVPDSKLFIPPAEYVKKD